MADSPYFTIMTSGGTGLKVAPGMTAAFSVKFIAEETKVILDNTCNTMQ